MMFVEPKDLDRIMGPRRRFVAEMWRRLKRQETDRTLLLTAVLELRKCYTLGDFRRWRAIYHVSA